MECDCLLAIQGWEPQISVTVAKATLPSLSAEFNLLEISLDNMPEPPPSETRKPFVGDLYIYNPMEGDQMSTAREICDSMYHRLRPLRLALSLTCRAASTT